MRLYMVIGIFFVSFIVLQMSFAQWTDISNSQLGLITSVKFISPTNGWILNRDSPSKQGLLRSTDGGNTWTRILQHPEGGFFRMLVYFDFLDDSLGYAVNPSGEYFRTTNGGRAWDTTLSGGAGARSRTIFSPNMAFSGDRYVYKSTDTLRHWSFVSQVPVIAQFSDISDLCFLTPNLFVAVGGAPATLFEHWDGTIELFRSTNSGLTWQNTYIDTMINCQAVAFASNSIGYAFTILGATPGYWSHSVTLKSTNGGASWFSIPASVSTSYFGIADAYFQNPDIGFICGSGLARSTDAGIRWNLVAGVMGGLSAMSWPDSIHGWVVGENGRMFRTVNGGGLPIQLASFTGRHLGGTRVRLDWRTLSETNNLGFYVERRRASDITFTQISQLIPGYGTTNEPHDYSFTDSNATINRWYYRLKQVDLAGPVHFTEPIIVDVTTGVSEVQTPRTFRLEQNYPNPFNPTTQIKFAIPRSGFVELKVFDLLGREVATLANEVRDAGSYDEVLDASLLASGVYIYKLRSGGFTDVRRMVLLR